MSLIPKSLGQCLQGADHHQLSHRPELTLLSLEKRREGYQGHAYHSGFHQWHPNGTSGAPGGTHWCSACHWCLVLFNSYLHCSFIFPSTCAAFAVPLPASHWTLSLLSVPLILYLQCLPTQLNDFEYYHDKKGRKNTKRDMVKNKTKQNSHRCTGVGNGVLTPFILVICVI